MCFDRALELEPGEEVVLRNNAETLVELGVRSECLSELRLPYRDWCALGLAMGDLERYEEALVCFDKALELKVDNERTWYNKGVTLSNLGKFEDALECYNRALRLNPGMAEAHFGKASAPQTPRKIWGGSGVLQQRLGAESRTSIGLDWCG